jgi:dinuclear metal center YbgI/SA1388 family protein
MLLDHLLKYLDRLLKPELFQDYTPNGLQVEGRKEIQRIVTGVTACQALLDKAVALKADAVLVHHGYFWQGESPLVIGMKHRRLKTLLNNDINLIAYHLPLDAHPTLGNNAQLGSLLGLNDPKPLGESVNGLMASLPSSLSGKDFQSLIKEKLHREPLYIPAEKSMIETVAWCTGAAQDGIERAWQYQADAYVTGEVSERTVHFARENNIHFYAAGHHATERYGIQALGQYLAKECDLDVKFVDIDSPV